MFDSRRRLLERPRRGDPRQGDRRAGAIRCSSRPRRPSARGDGPNDVGSSRFHLIRAVEASLRRLGTDYIDLFQLHGFDALTPVEEALGTLDDLVRAGKIRYIGCSNFSGWHLMKSLAVSERYGLAALRRAPGVLLAGRPRLRVGADAARRSIRRSARWSGARSAGARLTGKIRRGQPRAGRAALQDKVNVDVGPPVADEYLYTRGRRARRGRRGDRQDRAADRAQLAAAAARPWPTVIIGARNEEQLRQNLGAVGWNLTPEQVATLDAASAVTPIYPYWHQRGFAERNPFPDRLDRGRGRVLRGAEGSRGAQGARSAVLRVLRVRSWLAATDRTADRR